MAETETERTRAFTNKSYEGYALYDTVRIKIFDKMMEASILLGSIQSTYGTTTILERDNDVLDFKALVVGPLWFLLIDKITYPAKNKDEFAKLKELEPYAFGKTKISGLQFSRAVEYFRIMRKLIEVLGITRFEQETKDVENLPDELNDL